MAWRCAIVCNMYFKNISGRRSGKLVAVECVGFNAARKNVALWLCQCDCGGNKVVEGRLLTGDKGVRSCGCLLAEKNRSRPVRGSTNLKHGHSTDKNGVTPEYISWSSMKQRCLNTKHSNYPRYGGSGIKVCQQWQESFEAFLADMGPKPQVRMTIDRINTDGDYTPINCRWATYKQQANNISSNVIVQLDSLSMTAAIAAEILNVPSRTIYHWASKSPDITERALRWSTRPGINQGLPVASELLSFNRHV